MFEAGGQHRKRTLWPNAPPTHDTRHIKTAMLIELAVMDYDKGWVQQFHIGAIRNNNARQFAAQGPDTGYDSIGDFSVARSMSNFFKTDWTARISWQKRLCTI